MRTAVATLTDDYGVDFVLLVCLAPLIPFYARLGWTLLERTAKYSPRSVIGRRWA